MAADVVKYYNVRIIIYNEDWYGGYKWITERVKKLVFERKVKENKN